MIEKTESKEFPEEMVHNNVTFGKGDKVMNNKRNLVGRITGFKISVTGPPVYVKYENTEGYTAIEDLTLIEKADKAAKK